MVGPSLSRRHFGALSASAVVAIALADASRPVAARAATSLQTLKSNTFALGVDSNTGGIFQLSNPSDSLGTNYVANPTNNPGFDVDDSRWLGDLIFGVRAGSATATTSMLTSLSDDSRTVSGTASSITVAYSGKSTRQNGISGFSVTEGYTLGGTNGDQLNWSIVIKNTSTQQLELTDIGVAVLMNSVWEGGNQTGIYEQNIGRHSFVAEDGSYMYWQRPNGAGPYLLMVPTAGTTLEYKNKARAGEGPFAESDPSFEGLVEYYIRSANVSVQRAGKAGSYLPATSTVLKAGAQATYGFTFRWAANYSELRNAIYAAGVVDAVSLPGMVVPRDQNAILAVRASGGINSVVGESGRNVTVAAAGTKNGYTLYALSFANLGPNKVIVTYANGRQSVLQYYSIEAIETLIAAHSDFLVKNQQAKTTRGYNGAFLQWDLQNKKLITWDTYTGGGWKQWMAGGSDDLGLAPAEFLSEKNVSAPIPNQISALDYYLTNWIQGYLQTKKDSSGNPTYEVYRWFDGQDGTPSDQGTWRVYNYIHVANTYFNMYRIRKAFPSMSMTQSADQYLLRAYNTLKACYTIPPSNELGNAAYNFGLMGESTLPDIIAALKAENHATEASTLQGYVKKKADTLFAEKYPFASEQSIDTTGFEASYTLAKMYNNTALAASVQSASLACRGVQPLWYYYGSDNRSMGESWWNLSYETPLGAWQQQDYLVSSAAGSAAERAEWIRSTYGAFVAGWANVNSTQMSADSANYGASCWIYQSEQGAREYDWIPLINGWWSWSGEADLGFWGAVRTASVAVVTDPVAGLYAYNGTVSLANGSYTISPLDGIRQRIILFDAGRFSLTVGKGRYTSATIATNLSTISITLQNVTNAAWAPTITLQNLPSGQYDVSVGSAAPSQRVTSDGSSPLTVTIPGLTGGSAVVKLAKV